MTRDEHIKRAEELLVESRGSVPTDYEIALAQVHATLALAIPLAADSSVGEVELRSAVPR